MAITRGKGGTPPKASPPKEAAEVAKEAGVSTDEVKPPKVVNEDGSQRMFLTRRGAIRDPFTLILYNRNVPAPMGYPPWCLAQLRAKVLVEVEAPLEPKA